jgi:DNA-binding NtrC family response regulator
MKMLLIDDDEWIRDSLSIFFESEGCQLKALETAEEGLEILKKQPYDIIIVDYRLPGMDGLDFFKRINQLCPDARKILITAYGNKALISEAMQLGIEDFIEKPFTTKSIEASLSMLIENRKLEGSESESHQLSDQKNMKGD